jgi:general secretion pathway protein B
MPIQKQALRLKKLQKEAVRPVSGPSAAVPAVQAVVTAPPADIKVSGIAWQDERSARRAVVNGFLMHEGSLVTGARITEILKDRVRFSTGDKTFEAPLLMTVVPATGK